MKTYIFNSKKEFIKMVKKDLFRKDIVKWAKKQPDLEIILKNCPIKYRKICILSGYLQFAKYADKTIFLNSWWDYIFKMYPEIKNYINF
jgi:hypothetical protein